MPNNPDNTDGNEPVLVDCRLMKCPLPVLRAQKVWALLPPGKSMRVLATDENASKDMAKLADHLGFSYIEQHDNTVLEFVTSPKPG